MIILAKAESVNVSLHHDEFSVSLLVMEMYIAPKFVQGVDNIF